MKQRVLIKSPKEFAGETGIVLWFNWATRMACIRFDRIRCEAMFHENELQTLNQVTDSEAAA